MPHLNDETAALAPAPLFSTTQWSVVSAAGEQDSFHEASGRGPLYDLLKAYVRDGVRGGQNTPTLAEIAERLDLTEGAVKKAVQRLRQRVRDSLRAKVAHTVSTPDQIDDELRHLRAALST